MIDAGLETINKPNLPLDFARTSRVTDFQEIKIPDYQKLPSDLINYFSRTTEIDQQSFDAVLDYLIATAPDQTQIMDPLLALIGNPDLVDIKTRLPRNMDPERVQEDIRLWIYEKINRLTDPRLPYPGEIVDQISLGQYLDTVLPKRFGFEHGTDLVKEKPFIHHPVTDETYNTITSATNIALVCSEKNPQLQEKTVAGISRALQQEDKWWVLGSADLKRTISPLTNALVHYLAWYKPQGAASAILEDLFRKVKQDEPVILAEMYPQKKSDLKFSALTRLQPVFDFYFNMAFEANPEETERFLLQKMYEDNTATLVVTDLLATRQELHDKQFQLGKGRSVKFFGRTFQLAGLPEDLDIELKELSGCVFAATNAGQVVGFVNLDPLQFSKEQLESSVSLASAEEFLYLSPKSRQPISADAANKFAADLPQLLGSIRSDNQSFTHVDASALPLPALYQLWSYFENHDADQRYDVEQFISEYGTSAIISLLSGEYGEKNIPLLVEFAQKAQEPRSQIIDGIEQVRTEDSFSEALIKDYSIMVMKAPEYAKKITPIPEKQAIVTDLILQRSKALLFAAAKMYLKQGQLTKMDEFDITLAFSMHTMLISSLADPTGQTARQMNVPYDLVRSFFEMHDPTDPDSRELFASTMDLWFNSNAEKQRGTEYAGKSEELTRIFYQEYAELEADADKTTGNTDLEIKRNLTSFDHDIEAGRLPREASAEQPVEICFVGIGNARIEKHIVEHLQKNTKGYKFVGIDITRPEELPSDIEFKQINMKVLGKEMPGRFKKLCLIWSPYMDVIELDEMMEVAQSLSQACAEQAVIEIDIHFPFGIHSYEKQLKEYKAAHPEEPFMMMFRDFERLGKPPVGKRFFASDPALINWVFGRYGFTPSNLPPTPAEIEKMCRKTSVHDEWITKGPQNDPDQQAVYRGGAGLNRITYKLVRGEQPSFIPIRLSMDLQEQPA